MATGTDISTRVRNLVNDEASEFVSSLRWSDAELIRWISDAQREIVKLKPEANTVTALFEVTAGVPRQRLAPTTAYRLIRVEANGADDAEEPETNLTAATGCAGTFLGFVVSGFSNPYYSWCATARGTWTGTPPLDTTLIALQSSSSVLSLLMQKSGFPAQGEFTSMSFIDKDGVPRTFTSASATFNTVGSGSEQAEWLWSVPNTMFADGESYEVTFT